jgi:hypothetical protein
MRFISEDPLGLAGGINPYVYANDDAVNGSDPSGMDAYISFDNNECQYSYYKGSSDLFFDIGGCDFSGGSGLVPNFDPLATDRSWGHPDQPPQGNAPSGPATGPTSGKPTPQQVFAAVGKELIPFNHAMQCGGASLIAVGTLALDANGMSELYELGFGERMAISTINAASIETARSTVIAVSVSTSMIRVPADATAVAHWTMGQAKEAGVMLGFDKARGEHTPWWGYLPGGASYSAFKSARGACR